MSALVPRSRLHPITDTRPARSLADVDEATRSRYDRNDARVREPFVGVTTADGKQGGLYAVEKAGAPTDSIQIAVESYLQSLDGEQRSRSSFPIDSEEWRRWNNSKNCLMRHGVGLEEMTAAQRETIIGIFDASFGVAGAELARNAMLRTNLLAELHGTRQYGEHLYWISVFGTPSATEPWGWQIDGHHVNFSCFVLGDQVVMSPYFLGSEPEIYAFAPTRLLEHEEAIGEEFLNNLGEMLRSKASIGETLAVDVHAGAFKDNAQINYEGISFADLPVTRQGELVAMVRTFLDRRMNAGHSARKLEEVERHLDDTHFAWMGGIGPNVPFYYRIHSPVVLLEFSHIANGEAFETHDLERGHIHTMLRTPNGNDYGRELLNAHRIAAGEKNA